MDGEKNLEEKTTAKESTKESDFLQEKIKDRPLNKRKLLKQTMATVGMAIVFGLIACITFTLLEPVISGKMYPEEATRIVTFPEEEKEVNPEDMAADDTELQIIQQGADADPEETNANLGIEQPSDSGDQEGETDTTTVTEETEMTTEQNQEDARYSLEHYQDMYVALGNLTAETQKFLVAVTTVTSDVNWISDTLENSTGESAGVIIADNGKELLILSDYSNLEGADSIYVTFCNGEQYEATIKEKDMITELAVLAIPLDNLKKSARNAITYATLGSSLGRTAVGQPVIAVGSPNGISESVIYGMVTSQGTALGLADSNYKCLTTDIYGSKSSSGVLVNMKGQVIGIIYQGSVQDDMENQLCAIGVSELKKTIEKLSNGNEMTYLGVHGAEINAAIRTEFKLPYGAYVTSIDMDSPAMRAGIQSGDIITKIGETEIMSFSEFINNLVQVKSDETVTLTIQRQGNGSYQQMTVDVTLTVQK